MKRCAGALVGNDALSKRLATHIYQRKPSDGSCDLYRTYDADDRLLYVGISNDALNRFVRHNRTSRWMDESITTLEIERFPSRAAAVAADQRALIEERPIFNISGKIQMPGRNFAVTAQRCQHILVPQVL